MIHLDTSFLIHALMPGTREDALLRTWLAAAETIVMGAVGLGRVPLWPAQQRRLGRGPAVYRPVPDFNRDHAVATARLFIESGRRRGSLADCMIAAAALSDAASIATTNKADF